MFIFNVSRPKLHGGVVPNISHNRIRQEEAKTEQMMLVGKFKYVFGVEHTYMIILAGEHKKNKIYIKNKEEKQRVHFVEMSK